MDCAAGESTFVAGHCPGCLAFVSGHVAAVSAFVTDHFPGASAFIYQHAGACGCCCLTGRCWMCCQSGLPKPGEMGKLVDEGKDVKRNRKWIAETLKYHNDLRAKHGAPPLKWDTECAAKAQLAADACAARGEMFHNNCQEYGHGQNIFHGLNGVFGAKEATEAWHNEQTDPGYRWDVNQKSPPDGCGDGTGHFTQLVWVNHVKVGMACDFSKKGYIVANYWPAGNYPGNFQNQVFPEGTRMRKRLTVRTKPFSGKVTARSGPLKEILDTLEAAGDTVTRADIPAKLADGWAVELNFKPNPDGLLTWKMTKGRLEGKGEVGF